MLISTTPYDVEKLMEDRIRQIRPTPHLHR